MSEQQDEEADCDGDGGEDDDGRESGGDGGGGGAGDEESGRGGGGDGSSDPSDNDLSDNCLSVAGTEVADEDVVLDSDADSSEPAGERAISATSSKRNLVSLKPITVTPKLESELVAFDAFRATPINQARKGGASAPTTREQDRSHILRLFAWLVHTGLLRRYVNYVAVTAEHRFALQKCGQKLTPTLLHQNRDREYQA